ncbi:NAD(P)H-hydrate dehydratase, partial [Eubacterium sp.]|uniref:NAD(P)H-hydrate dehydratase n=1 Tax=Eubacterium sp. TaxID=142586 RepID=UPI0039960037
RNGKIFYTSITSLSHISKWCSVVAIGPGIGTGTIQSMMVEKVLESDLPAVIDADAINTIANNEIIKKKLRRNVVITPHLGEMSRLLSVPIEEITKDLVKYAKKINYVYGANVVLKDARTIIATEGQTYINISGNNGMATAGSGDVLTGIIAGLIGINAGVDVASFMGTYIHGLAGDYAITETTKAGLMATDIIKAIPEVMER